MEQSRKLCCPVGRGATDVCAVRRPRGSILPQWLIGHTRTTTVCWGEEPYIIRIGREQGSSVHVVAAQKSRVPTGWHVRAGGCASTRHRTQGSQNLRRLPSTKLASVVAFASVLFSLQLIFAFAP